MPRRKKTEIEAAEAAVVNTEAVVEEKPVVKRGRKKASETAEEKVTEKKTTVRKTTSRKKVVTNTEVYVQFWGKEVYTAEVVEAIKKIWTDEMGKKENELTDLKIYIKPEDNGAHYVINGEITGFLAL